MGYSVRIFALYLSVSLVAVGKAFVAPSTKLTLTSTAAKRLSPSTGCLRAPSRSSQRCQVMQSNSREESDFETTVDWDAEIRKLNAGELDGKPRPRGWDDYSDAEKVIVRSKSQVKAKVRKAQESAQDALEETSYQVRGALRKAPRWQQLSRDWRFWVGVVAALSLLTSLMSATSSRQDLMVLNEGSALGSAAYGALIAATSPHITAGEAASQLVESGAGTFA